MMSVRLKIIKEVKRMADIISGNSRFGDGNNSKNKKVIHLVPEEQKQEKNLDENEIKHKVINRRKRIIIISVIIVAAIIAAVFAISAFIDGITYKDYSVMKSVNRDDTDTTMYMGYADGYVRYSNDGIAYYNKKGTAIWNQTYTMQKPQVKICGSIIAVGDINGSKIYIFDKNGNIGIVDTSLAISQIEVAKQGVVAAVLEDNDANYINLYKTDGTKIYTVKTSLAGDGYPLDISISPDAAKLVASYLYVSGETMKTNVVFYNFSEVGQNETERVVGGFNHYDSTIVADVNFIDENTVAAVGEDVVSIYSIKEYPKLVKEINIDNEIDRVLFGDKYIGLVLKNLATIQELKNCSEYHIHKNIYETSAMVSSFIREYETGELALAVEEKATSTVIAYIRSLEVSLPDKRCDIKFGITFSKFNTNLIEEALNAVLDYLFNQLDFNIVISKFYDSNKKLTEIKLKIEM